MIRETYYFFQHGRKVQKPQKEMGFVDFQKDLARKLDADGYAELRSGLVSDLEGDILEIGTGTGATFHYYEPNAKVTAIEPHNEFRARPFSGYHATPC